MSYTNPDAESALERATVELFASLGWETARCYHETFGPLSLLGRETSADVVLPVRLRSSLEKLNPGISPLAADLAIDELTKDRSTFYKTTVPQVFWYNALIVLSNGSKAKVGSLTVGWEHFAEWKKINDEGEEGVVSLALIRAVCDPAKLLDLVESFTLFSEAKGELTKLVAKNHQYLGVNNAIAAVTQIRENAGKLGVFWHAQGRARVTLWFSSRKKFCGGFRVTGRL